MSIASNLTAALAAAEAFALGAEEYVDVTAVEIESAQVAALIDLSLSDMVALGMSGQEIRENLTAVKDRVQQLSQVIVSELGALVRVELSTGRSAYRLAFDLYKDWTRWVEIAALNELRNPNWIDAGTVLRVRHA